MKKIAVLFALPLLAVLFSLSLITACSDGDGDDDDDDDNDVSSGEGLCYVQCEAGCIKVGACLSGEWTDDACQSWGEQQCGQDDCAATVSEYVPGCSICLECADKPDWY